jgi:hypothetical protein
MGLQFRKSKNLGGGFRLNASHKGLGMSWGVKGFRVGVGSDGKKRMTASIPGTGVRYTQTLKSNNTSWNVKTKHTSIFGIILFLAFLPLTLPCWVVYKLFSK